MASVGGGGRGLSEGSDEDGRGLGQSYDDDDDDSALEWGSRLVMKPEVASSRREGEWSLLRLGFRFDL